MTAINYPDCTAMSPNRRYRFEAMSPDNGSIAPPSGSASDRDGFEGCFQSDFRYRLIRCDDSLLPTSSVPAEVVVWERIQEPQEESPHELLVADDGWSAIRTHGFRPEVIAIEPGGSVVLRVRVLPAQIDDKLSEGGIRKGAQGQRDSRIAPALSWRAERLAVSTAGNWWAENSWPYFCRTPSGRFFVWRTYWGQRLVVDLGDAKIVDEQEQTQALKTALDDVERRHVGLYLSELATHRLAAEAYVLKARTDPARQWPTEAAPEWRLLSAFQLVGVHQMHEHTPRLRDWEHVDRPASYTSCTALKGEWWVERQFVRPIVAQSLRMLRVEPIGYPAYGFRRGHDRVERLPFPARIADRRDRLLTLHTGLSGEEVLSLVGSPDHIRKRSHPIGKGLHAWTEDWEYDSLSASGWRTTRLTWEQGDKPKVVHLTSIIEDVSDWIRSNQRTIDQLGW